MNTVLSIDSETLAPSNWASIELRGIGMRFRTFSSRRTGLKEALFNRIFRMKIRPRQQEELWALRDVDLKIEHGERVGILGRNGAGKSTLLKLMAGIYMPSAGRLEINGRVAPLTDLGTGFQPELSARENILLYGALLGFRRATLEQRVGKIIEFAQLEAFQEMPVKYFSTGMMMRLAFSAATDIEPEVLLIDEVFAGGDASFMVRARERMLQLIDQSRLLVLVSHNIGLIREMCNRVLWLDGGSIHMDGPPEEVCDRYLAEMVDSKTGPTRSRKRP